MLLAASTDVPPKASQKYGTSKFGVVTMLRSISSALVISALVAAPASAQFGGQAIGNFPIDGSAAGGQTQYSGGFAATNGLTQIDDQLGPNVVVASPEPTSVALVATGLIGIVGVARRKRNSRLG